MKTNLLIFTSLIAFHLQGWAGGVGVGTGGDSVLCTPSNTNPMQGVYSLDYLMTLDAIDQSQSVDVKSWEESQNRLLQLFADKYPALKSSFEDFLKGTNNHDDWTQNRIWLAAPHGLIDISDEQMRRTLPANCGHPKEDGPISLIQTVVRKAQPNLVTYEFDAQTLAALATRPLQYSYLLVHEWLWDHTDDPQVIRWANQFLHSKAAAQLTPEKFQLSLNRIGIAAGYGGFYNVCLRSPSVRQQLEQLTQKNCDDILPSDLAKITNLHVYGSLSPNMQVNDLNGLTQINSFSYGDAPNLTQLPAELFAQNPNLQQVSFYNLGLTEIPRGLFKNNLMVASFDLRRMPLQNLPVDLDAYLPTGLGNLTIGEADLSEISVEFFQAAQKRIPFSVHIADCKKLNEAQVKSAADQAGFIGIYLQ